MFWHALAVLVALAVYVIYYFVYVARAPRVYGGNAGLRRSLRERCPMAAEKFYPTPWCVQSHLQTMCRSLFKSRPKVPYERELLDTPDGGLVSLDWHDSHVLDGRRENTTIPTLLMLPGLTGDSCDSYMAHMAIEAETIGYRVAVFNNRGNGGVPLKTPKLYNAAFTDDLELVVKHVKAKYPVAPLVCCGVSMGGMILFNYLAKHPEAPVTGAVIFSMPWTIEKCVTNLENNLNELLFNRQLTRLCIKNFIYHKEMLSSVCTPAQLQSCKRIRDVDETIITKMFGFDSCEHYYNVASPHWKVGSIRHPVICVNAADDMFGLEHTIPLEQIEANAHGLTLLLTARGGHIGFLEGLYPRHRGYSDRLLGALATMLVEHERVKRGEAECLDSNGNNVKVKTM